jgi:RNA polymerase sigma-70 factor (ECF subfamily)
MNPMISRTDELALFYRDHAGRVLAWAIRLGGAYVDAEDIAHDVFAIAVRRLPEFRGDAEVATWLFAITRRVVANARRRAALRRFVGLDSVPEIAADIPAPDEQLASRRRRRTVQLALEKLSRSQREAVALVDLEGVTAVEAGEILGVPVGTVYSRLHHGRRTLAAALERERFAAVGEAGVVAASGRGR